MIRRAAVCLAFAIYCFLNTWVELAEGKAPYYARYDPLRVSVPAVLCWQLLIFAALLGGWELCRRRKNLNTVAHAVFLALCAIPAGVASLAVFRAVPFDLTPVVRQRWFWPLALAALLPFGSMALWRPKWFGKLVLGAFLTSCPVLAVVLFQAAQATLLRYPSGAYLDGPLAKPRGTPPSRVRVVWIIFDELSQAIAFDHRPADLKLPNLDRLAAESLRATAAHSPADATQESIPSLLLGETVLRTQLRGPKSLLLYTAARPDGFAWNSAPNVFDRARELGFDSALAGWYHPYGRLLNHSLTACYWTASWLLPGLEEPFAPGGLLDAMRHRARCQLAAFPLLGHLDESLPRTYKRQETNARFQYLLQHARALAADRAQGLVFLHLPVPHPPAIYSRAEGKFTNVGPRNYLDGVALADWTLGELRRSMEAAGVWDDTALIVSADHGWRLLWRGGPDWTPEEAKAASGIDTSGVPFLVKLPGSDAGAAYARPLNTVLTSDLILSLLQGQLTKISQLSQWLDGTETRP